MPDDKCRLFVTYNLHFGFWTHFVTSPLETNYIVSKYVDNHLVA